MLFLGLELGIHKMSLGCLTVPESKGEPHTNRENGSGCHRQEGVN